jgi:hypothetical protein
VFGPSSFGVNSNCWPPNGAIVVMNEGSVSMGSCRIPGRQWERDSLGLCVLGPGHPLVSVVCLCACVFVLGFVRRCWVGVAMLWHDCEYDDVWNAMRVRRVV